MRQVIWMWMRERRRWRRRSRVLRRYFGTEVGGVALFGKGVEAGGCLDGAGAVGELFVDGVVVVGMCDMAGCAAMVGKERIVLMVSAESF